MLRVPPAEAETMRLASEEAGSSRIWAGIHYRIDVEAGLALGREVAQLVVERVQAMTRQ